MPSETINTCCPNGCQGKGKHLAFALFYTFIAFASAETAVKYTRSAWSAWVNWGTGKPRL